ncbi:MAG TPA: hypothetical protein VNC39_01435 [Acidocella sp.]|jgi:hypothetical protein|uniref:hypothetical protein n=1 Tax=Acidocella sp. TaxID=50710 RepID=UPI002B87B7BA|nr:hypothetical protein [Acidocella sp.]HVE20612.1 hypothetical protein [Acidocella sp.]
MSIERARYIEVEAGVRYWEGSTLNGEVDEDGNIPRRKRDAWCPVIELETGRVIDWPPGTTADIHYKVCDDGRYWLLDASGAGLAKWKGYYVPNSILCVNDNGYGDYIIMKIGGDGLVIGWKKPDIDADQWEMVAK